MKTQSQILSDLQRFQEKILENNKTTLSWNNRALENIKI